MQLEIKRLPEEKKGRDIIFAELEDLEVFAVSTSADKRLTDSHCILIKIPMLAGSYYNALNLTTKEFATIINTTKVLPLLVNPLEIRGVDYEYGTEAQACGHNKTVEYVDKCIEVYGSPKNRKAKVNKDEN